MAFICTLVDTEDYVNVRRDGNSYQVSSQVGYDDGSEKIYYIVIALDVVPGWDCELRYWLDEYDGELESFYTYWDGFEVAQFIGKDDRKKILGSLLSLVRHLVTLTRPPVVMMCTKDEEPAPMRKHVLVAQAIGSCGYNIQTFDSYFGQRVWRMELRETADVVA